MPEKRFLMEPHLMKVVGSEYLEAQVRRLAPSLHLFGHSHIPIDLDLEGIRYIQWPLGYFRESDLQCKPIFVSGPLLVLDSTLGRGPASLLREATSLDTSWTKYYRKNSRDPLNMTLSPWLIKRLDDFSGLVRSSSRFEDREEHGEK